MHIHTSFNTSRCVSELITKNKKLKRLEMTDSTNPPLYILGPQLKDDLMENKSLEYCRLACFSYGGDHYDESDINEAWKSRNAKFSDY